MKKITLNLFIVFILSLLSNEAAAQLNLEVKDLFASGYLIKDSSKMVEAVRKADTVSDSMDYKYAHIRISFIVNRPEEVARVIFKIGKNINTDEVFSGTATIQMHRKKLFSVFNGQYEKLLGDKVIINWVGDKSVLKNAKYVTLQVQSSDGIFSNREFTFVRLF